MKKIKDSRFFEPLLERYARGPSIALCRVPELELFSQVELVDPVLDHCCGDGYISAQAFPGRKMSAGVDFSESQLAAAKARGNYADLKWGDAGLRLPFEDGSFNTILNNSGIEHIPDLNTAVAEIARVLRPGGKVFMNVLNSRYFDRWPLSPESAQDYREFQPFYHALDEKDWRAVLEKNGLTDVSFTDYFDTDVSRILADYDYRYSAFYYRKRMALEPIMSRLLPPSSLRAKWRRLFGDLDWDAPPLSGSGFLITAGKKA